jgi:hypothetical protein
MGVSIRTFNFTLGDDLTHILDRASFEVPEALVDEVAFTFVLGCSLEVRGKRLFYGYSMRCGQPRLAEDLNGPQA